jgi:hypothetical protein
VTEGLEMISRRRMFSFLGAAAAISVVGLPILTPLDAEAATKGMVRRQERRYRRATRRYTRRTNRYNRRKAARGM